MAASAADRIGPALGAFAVAAALAGLNAIHTPPARATPSATVPQPATTDIPVPPPRPDSKSNGPADDDDDSHAAAEPPLPPARPVDLGTASGAAAPPPSPATLAEESACQERLVKLGVRFEPLPAIADGQCGAAHPLRVSGLPEALEISAPATVVCPVAEALARWTREVIIPEAARHLEARPVRIAIGTSYECRNQNRRATGKLSEHAFANGVDIGGFDFKGRKAVAIGDHAAETPEALFQQAIRTQACNYFTTVLGPGSDAAHATHLHLDLRGRGRGFRICQ